MTLKCFKMHSSGSHLFFKSLNISLQGIFLVYDITSERSFQHIMKWASDVDEVSHGDWGFKINRHYFPHCRKGKTDELLLRGRRLTKNRCLTWCDKNQMLWPDGYCFYYCVYYVPSLFLSTSHHIFKCVVINIGRTTFFPLAVTFFYLLWVFIKQFRLPCFPLPIPRWLYSINLAITDLISSMSLSEYILYWSWHASHLLLI